MRDELTRLSHWFPLVEAAGLPVPKTRIIHGGDDLFREVYGESSQSLAPLAERIREAATELGGPPIFLRTDHTSAKHGWNETCYVANLDLVEHHIVSIVEHSENVDICGLPTDTWVAREMLNTKLLFRAFRGRMPITREFRYFVLDGQVLWRQAYWPEEAVFFIPEDDDGANRSALAAASILHLGERAELDALSLKASAALPGYWSVDWLETTDRGWVLTDCAEGDRSYKWGEVSL